VTRISRLVATVAALASFAWPAHAEDAKRALVLGSTTSVRDSGLMDELLPLFEKESGLHVQLIAVGSGAALKLGEEGNADVLVTHEPDGEKALVEKGALVDHHAFMENYFLVAGPAGDPAGIAKATSAADAIARIAQHKAAFASRGDDSGTHKREQALFKQAGLDPNANWDGLVRTGQGMGATLQIAGEKHAYVLTDRATFQAFAARTQLAPVFAEKTADLRNVYSVSRPNPEKLPAGRVDVEGAKRFAAFITSPATAEHIRAFGAKDGASLFTPIAEGDAAK
jgi:tungstate transport system substrate-binding protein